MDKREKVIKGLECLSDTTEAIWPTKERCENCPWGDSFLNDFGFETWACRSIDCAKDALALLKEQEPHWISVEDGLPQEHDTIFAKLYGTDKWRNSMFLKVSDDVRVVKVYRDGTKRVHHDHTVDGRWDSERKGLDVYGHVTHWMPNPELPLCTSRPTDEQRAATPWEAVTS